MEFEGIELEEDFKHLSDRTLEFGQLNFEGDLEKMSKCVGRPKFL